MPTKQPAQKKRGGRRFPRRFRRRGRKSNARSLPTRSLATIPDRLFTTMTYSTNVTRTASLTPTSYVFRSSLFDPDFTGVGTQPLGRDQWASFYNDYRIHGVKYIVTFMNESTTTQADIAVLHKKDGTVETNIDQAYERSYAKKKILGLRGTSAGVRTIKGFMSSARTLGFTKLQFSTDDLTKAAMNSNPVTLSFLHCLVNPVDNTTSTTVRIRVSLTYYCELFSRVVLSGS